MQTVREGWADTRFVTKSFKMYGKKRKRYKRSKRRKIVKERFSDPELLHPGVRGGTIKKNQTQNYRGHRYSGHYESLDCQVIFFPMSNTAQGIVTRKNLTISCGH